MAERRARVLRVAVVDEGRITAERLVGRGEAVVAGDGRGGTWALPALPAGTRVIEPAEGGWVVCADPRIVGRITRADGALEVRGEAPVPLSEVDRGKLRIGAATLLFQLVDPPRARPVGPIRSGEFRPRLLREGDPLFVGFLGVWTALGVALAILAWGTEPPAPTVDAPPRALRQLVMRDPAPLPPETRVVLAPPVAPAPAPKVSPPTRADAPAKGDPGPDPGPKSKEELERSSALLSVLGSRNGRRDKIVQEVWADRTGLGSPDEVLKQAGSASAEGSPGTRTERARGGEAEEGGEIARLGGGRVEGVGIELVVRADLAPDAGTVAALGDAAAIRAEIAEQARSLAYCYEKQLKASPGLSGRLEVGWRVAGGRVVGVPTVVADTSGDPALAACVTAKIRAWTFPADVEGELSWPFLFQRKG